MLMLMLSLNVGSTVGTYSEMVSEPTCCTQQWRGQKESYERSIRGSLVYSSRNPERTVAKLAPRFPHCRAQHAGPAGIVCRLQKTAAAPGSSGLPEFFHLRRFNRKLLYSPTRKNVEGFFWGGDRFFWNGRSAPNSQNRYRCSFAP